MPNALIGSLAILDDLGEGLPLNNLNWEWMYFQPLVLLWAKAIYCPARFVHTPPDFKVDVGFSKSNEVLNRSLSNAWKRLTSEGIIRAVPLSVEMEEAARIAFYSVRNRLTQTAIGGLPPIGIQAIADLQPNTPPDQLRIGDHRYCINHLDSIASHLVVSQATDSVWLSTEREDHAVRWLYCGGLDPDVNGPRAAKAVFDRVDILRLPKCDFIPPVANCAHCGDHGAKCYSESYGVDDWVSGAEHRLERILSLRDSPEISSLRRFLDDISRRIRNGADHDELLRILAEQELKRSAELAEKRMTKDLGNLTKYCDIATLYSIPMALLGSQTGSTLIGNLGFAVATASRGISTSAKLLLEERYRWLKFREIDI